MAVASMAPVNTDGKVNSKPYLELVDELVLLARQNPSKSFDASYIQPPRGAFNRKLRASTLGQAMEKMKRDNIFWESGGSTTATRYVLRPLCVLPGRSPDSSTPAWIQDALRKIEFSPPICQVFNELGVYLGMKKKETAPPAQALGHKPLVDFSTREAMPTGKMIGKEPTALGSNGSSTTQQTGKGRRDSRASTGSSSGSDMANIEELFFVEKVPHPLPTADTDHEPISKKPRLKTPSSQEKPPVRKLQMGYRDSYVEEASRSPSMNASIKKVAVKQERGRHYDVFDVPSDEENNSVPRPDLRKSATSPKCPSPVVSDISFDKNAPGVMKPRTPSEIQALIEAKLAQNPWMSTRLEELHQTYQTIDTQIVLVDDELQVACLTCPGKNFKFNFRNHNLGGLCVHLSSQGHQENASRVELRQLRQQTGSSSISSVADVIQQMIDNRGSEPLPSFPSNKCTRFCTKYGLGVLEFNKYSKEHPEIKLLFSPISDSQTEKVIENISGFRRRDEDQLEINLTMTQKNKELASTLTEMDNHFKEKLRVVQSNFDIVEKSFVSLDAESMSRKERVDSRFGEVERSQKELDNRLQTVESGFASTVPGKGIASMEEIMTCWKNVTTFAERLDKLEIQFESVPKDSETIKAFKEQVKSLDTQYAEWTIEGKANNTKLLALEQDLEQYKQALDLEKKSASSHIIEYKKDMQAISGTLLHDTNAAASQKAVYERDMKELRTIIHMDREAAALQKAVCERETKELRTTMRMDREAAALQKQNYDWGMKDVRTASRTDREAVAALKLDYEKDMTEFRTTLCLDKEAAASQKLAHEEQLAQLLQQIESQQGSYEQELAQRQETVEIQQAKHEKEVVRLQQQIDNQQEYIRLNLKSTADQQLAHNEELLTMRKKHMSTLRSLTEANSTVLGDLMARLSKVEQNNTSPPTQSNTAGSTPSLQNSGSQSSGGVKTRGGTRDGGAGSSIGKGKGRSSVA